jgi:hypothetical protein
MKLTLFSLGFVILTMLFFFSFNNAYAETFEFLDDNGNEELVSVFVSTNKEAYVIGDDLEFVVTIEDPWQGEFSIWGVDPNNDNLQFFHYDVFATDGKGEVEYDVYSTGQGIVFQYDSGTSNVKIQNFWNEEKPSGDYDLCFQLYNSFQICREVSFDSNLSAELPDWIRNTFVWYAEGIVSETELLNSIKYLVENDIIPVQKNQDSEKDETIANLSEKINSLLYDIKNLNNRIDFLENENQKLKNNIETQPVATEEYTYESITKFDPEIVQSAKENIPKFQNFFRVILNQCESVNSYDDYLTFITAVALMEDELVQNTNDMNLILSALELEGYDEHAEVGPLISKTRQTALDASECIDEILYLYG